MGMLYKGSIRAAAFLFIAVLAQAVVADADDLQPHQEIQQVAEDFVFEALAGEDVEVRVRSLDSRLRLQRCDVPLEAFWSPGSRQRGATSVGVACEGEKPWKIYVRVNIKVMREVVVAARPLVRGDILQQDDVRTMRKDISRINNGAYLEDVSALIGYELRQSVAANSLLYARMLQAPKLVRRGDKVTVLAVAGGLEVRVLGEALADGGKGQMIRVRNLSSKRIVQGEVVSNGMVRIAM